MIYARKATGVLLATLSVLSLGLAQPQMAQAETAQVAVSASLTSGNQVDQVKVRAIRDQVVKNGSAKVATASGTVTIKRVGNAIVVSEPGGDGVTPAGACRKAYGLAAVVFGIGGTAVASAAAAAAVFGGPVIIGGASLTAGQAGAVAAAAGSWSALLALCAEYVC